LSYLKRFPITALKIAQPFVDEIVTRRDDRSIAESIVALARALGLTTTAEGVEHEAQAAVLRELGADRLQGYRYGKPAAADGAAAAAGELP